MRGTALPGERASGAGLRVALTRAAGSNDELAARLRAEGLEAVECPLVAVEAIPGPPIRADAYDWLALTSRNAVELLLRRLEGGLPPVAVVGPGTAQALRKHGFEPALVAQPSTQEGLLAALPRPAGRILFAGARGARDLLVRELGADFVPLYASVPVRPEAFPPSDLVALASGTAARSFASLAIPLPCVSLGPTTSRAARECGLDVLAEAETHDLDGLVAAVKLAGSRIASSPS
ncbi:MAG: uroporphyrinogen-III synthase [Thermoleophilia bacterium]|nr:uroporphyrinogen-III synthase [Thermoleophilia bacterium]